LPPRKRLPERVATKVSGLAELLVVTEQFAPAFGTVSASERIATKVSATRGEQLVPWA
jgi:hypothetical protein